MRNYNYHPWAACFLLFPFSLRNDATDVLNLKNDDGRLVSFCAVAWSSKNVTSSEFPTVTIDIFFTNPQSLKHEDAFFICFLSSIENTFETSWNISDDAFIGHMNSYPDRGSLDSINGRAILNWSVASQTMRGCSKSSFRCCAKQKSLRESNGKYLFFGIFKCQEAVRRSVRLSVMAFAFSLSFLDVLFRTERLVLALVYFLIIGWQCLVLAKTQCVSCTALDQY